jgi:hypothetical protein
MAMNVGTQFKATRLEGNAEDIITWLVNARRENNTGWNRYLMLREFQGAFIDEPQNPETQLPSPVPGVLIEGVEVIEKHDFQFINVVVWSGGSMHEIVLDLATRVVVFDVNVEEA